MSTTEDVWSGTLGSYTPTFFKMFVDTNEDLDDLLKLNKLGAALYFHEYIHYLQDISTVYGLFNICINVNRMRESVFQILSSDNKEFHVPIRPTVGDERQVFQNLSLRQIYLGDTISKNIPADTHVVFIEIIERKVAVGDNKESLVNVVKVYFSNGTIYDFGATCIMESVAYLAETIIFPGIVPKAPDLPYRVVELVVEYLYPEFGVNKLNIIALADASMAVFHPGDFFYKALTSLRKENIVPENPYFIYEYADNIELNYEDTTTINELLRMMSLRASDMIVSYLNNERYINTNSWIREVLSNALELRLEKRGFILDIIQSGEFIHNKDFATVFEKVGSPLVLNTSQEAWFYPGKVMTMNVDYDTIQPSMLWGINQIHKLFMKKQTHCEMVSYCQGTCKEEGIDDITDHRCHIAPWLKVSDSPRCAYGQIWRMWGLAEKHPLVD